MDPLVLALGSGVVGFVVGALSTALWARSSDSRESKRAHEAAQDRDAPVALGDTYELAISDFSDHHSGERIAVGKVEGFVLFVEDVPSGAGVGDVIRARVLSFNDGETSADASFEGRA